MTGALRHKQAPSVAGKVSGYVQIAGLLLRLAFFGGLWLLPDRLGLDRLAAGFSVLIFEGTFLMLAIFLSMAAWIWVELVSNLACKFQSRPPGGWPLSVTAEAVVVCAATAFVVLPAYAFLAAGDPVRAVVVLLFLPDILVLVQATLKSPRLLYRPVVNLFWLILAIPLVVTGIYILFLFGFISIRSAELETASQIIVPASRTPTTFQPLLMLATPRFFMPIGLLYYAVRFLAAWRGSRRVPIISVSRPAKSDSAPPLTAAALLGHTFALLVPFAAAPAFSFLYANQTAVPSGFITLRGEALSGDLFGQALCLSMGLAISIETIWFLYRGMRKLKDGWMVAFIGFSISAILLLLVFENGRGAAMDLWIGERSIVLLSGFPIKKEEIFFQEIETIRVDKYLQDNGKPNPVYRLTLVTEGEEKYSFSQSDTAPLLRAAKSISQCSGIPLSVDSP